MTIDMPKPAGSPWTDEQWDAIRLSGENLLVAAAAGSGKTAVLVERIIRKVMNEAEPIDVDRLLIVTFTKAAASEMRERIREALEKALTAQPQSAHLRRQLAYVHRASITTLHSFCMDVIRRYYPLIELDPGFRIANETEAELLRQDLLGDVLEEYYAAGGEDGDFYRLVDWFSGDKNDDALYRLIQTLYDFSRSHPEPERWLAEMAERFHMEGDGAKAVAEGATPWQQSLLGDVRMELRAVRGELEEALRIALKPDGPYPYADNLAADLALTDALASAASKPHWEAAYAAFREAAFGKLKPCRGDDIDKELQERVKALRERAKKKLGAIRDELFSRDPEALAAELQAAYPVMKQLVGLVGEFDRRYRAEKRARRLLDFGDLEHYCLQILLAPGPDGDGAGLSAAAHDYREQFAEVLVDEYQDTNMVQETILRLISQAAPGNRFMVGDVKQSIYRFRLAEPGLFLAKYRSFRTGGEVAEREAAPAGAGDSAAETADPADGPGAPRRAPREDGRRIDLARNFRSRREVVDAVNFLFRQIMHERAAEIEYDRSAELVCGAGYPEWTSRSHDLTTELMLIDRGGGSESGEDPDEDGSAVRFDPGEAGGGPKGAGTPAADDEEPAETAQLEARAVAMQIRKLTGMGGAPFPVYDKRLGAARPVEYRDIVILLRATQAWAPVFIDELKAAGIPVYAELNTGYFSAVEVETVLSLLKIIDNPYQDIPLAAVLRSPMFGFTAEALAQIRLAGRGRPFYDAVRSYALQPEEAFADSGESVPDRAWAERLRAFLNRLEAWRNEARQGPLPDLIWRLYRETGYFDWVGGMPGGGQRQANLRALYDRARQYEATSLRGVFRFLRFIERMREGGGDLGTARALGEQEDVVRIMSIHKSKGLEFPVVFVAGLGKSFNMQDLNGSFLLHRELGFGPRFVDTALRIGYPTLGALAIRRRLKLETLAEEMRVLYVALTRPKEKLYLVGSARSLEKRVASWSYALECGDPQLPDYRLTGARCYLDWIAPAVLRHAEGGVLAGFAAPRSRGAAAGGTDPAAYRPGNGLVPEAIRFDPSRWTVSVIVPEQLPLPEAAAAGDQSAALYARWQAVRRLEPVQGAEDGPGAREEIERRLKWIYPWPEAPALFSKTTVTELKRLDDMRRAEAEFDPQAERHPRLRPGPRPGSRTMRRPRFLERRGLTSAERGTVYHSVMQHLELRPELTPVDIARTLDEMVLRQLLAAEHRDTVDPAVVIRFLQSPLGLRVTQAGRIKREVPFSYRLRAGEVYDGVPRELGEEPVLVQGVIDCLFEEDGGWVLLDYKTDAVGRSPHALQAAVDRYRVQVDLYAAAIERIMGQPVRGAYLYFFDGGHAVDMLNAAGSGGTGRRDRR